MEKNQDSSSGKEGACRQTHRKQPIVCGDGAVSLLWRELPEGYRDWKTSIGASAVGPAIRGKIKLYQTKPMVDVLLPVAQIMIKWKTAEEDPIDYLNGIVNDQYRRKLGLKRPLSKTELQKIKAYLDQNVKDWQDKENWEDKDGKDIYKLVPRFLQTSSAASR